ncbi:hypothetical protein BAE44_0025466 [Dichanthelium oligosanthes]|uniref:Uncharacterized protein n=1 Tax=Dichanthelium oligosanthes TaxID=888268 RepID=A0A1E5UKW0_9POAL|nr:hypothetical protein BAE44_0025466 [Dichanthelium oligosanthes]
MRCRIVSSSQSRSLTPTRGASGGRETESAEISLAPGDGNGAASRAHPYIRTPAGLPCSSGPAVVEGDELARAEEGSAHDWSGKVSVVRPLVPPASDWMLRNCRKWQKDSSYNHHQLVTATAIVQLVEEEEQEMEPQHGSVVRRQTVPRDRYSSHHRLMADYFDDPPVYNDNIFHLSGL